MKKPDMITEEEMAELMKMSDMITEEEMAELLQILEVHNEGALEVHNKAKLPAYKIPKNSNPFAKKKNVKLQYAEKSTVITDFHM